MVFDESLAPLLGAWSMIPERSVDTGRFGSLLLTVSKEGGCAVLDFQWGRGAFSHHETVRCGLDGAPTANPIPDRAFAPNVYMAVDLVEGGARSCRLSASGSVFRVEDSFPVRTSQGTTAMRMTHVFTLFEGALTYELVRSHRPREREVMYRLKRSGADHAFYMALENDWSLQGKLPLHAALISLQGLANAEAARLYFVYPKEWDYKFSPEVMDYLRKERDWTFTKLATLEQALEKFRGSLSGCVVWDREVRTSLIVAFTAAGLRRGLVVTEDMLPLMERLGIPVLEDLRGIFRGKKDAEIYAWARERYWKDCSRDMIVWLGGDSGSVMKPGVADWGIKNRTFFSDLSAHPAAEEEYRLADGLLSEMKPYGMVFGWHSYGKDTEEQHVTLLSRHALRMEGLHSLPNMSFSCHVPLKKGFTFRNNHTVRPDEACVPENKVYVSCIQTDCLGLGAWMESGRGEMPYAWEVTMNWVWLAPAMMEFFYSQATPQDYFIGSLSGPGYLYPKAVPREKLPGLIAMARDLMKKLDLRVFEIMDYSEGFFHLGNADLPKEIVDLYYEGMPEAIGFANGYGTASTFTVRNKVPFLSFDYYLTPTEEEDQAAADLRELAALNEKRPYFLLFHVRNFNDIHRVKRILDRLGPEFEVAALDRFMRMAGERPTFLERYKA